MSGLPSQPSINALLASLEGNIDTGINVEHVRELDAYWAEMRLLDQIQKFTNMKSHGQLTNLLFQAQQLVTPTSKVVGDLAQFMVSNKLTSDDIRRLVILWTFLTLLWTFEGLIGQPYVWVPHMEP
ncbi:AKR_HP2_G0004090.mRNA.1.CDS.1 [Saccharomyces cerevisiae]|nr:AKR_HP2_G0004090.mRNA.1.CDS.1 [Saccharomyces cerevisiae]CAI6406632.1 AKR_HP2_G0004090.mRNA.1.CDS.1 [Saccharomyces cerevisiae]